MNTRGVGCLINVLALGSLAFHDALDTIRGHGFGRGVGTGSASNITYSVFKDSYAKSEEKS